MELLKLYAVKDNSGNVLIFRDREQTNHACTFGVWRSDRPTRRNRWLMFNCYKWGLVWIR